MDKYDLREEWIEHLVIGSGAAGCQAALQLYENGEEDIAILTESITAGTSRNTGSDKQTYYKLSLASGDMDSVITMAQDLFAGQCVDGDMALCEAALSARGFFHLVELGVPFPCTEYGEYMGYKTDHDRGRRATSAGPYTSQIMTDVIWRRIQECPIRICDRMLAIRLEVRNGRIRGVLCLSLEQRDRAEYVLFHCRDVILATGGPAGMYRDSVYPVSQLGSSGMAFEAGVAGKNLTEWQFGLASLDPRWNVSGTYMQAMPLFISTERDGSDEREFLREYFPTRQEMLSQIFLKGYQWPFDVSKVFGGSSQIDLAVYRETVLKGRRVYLDFTRDPEGGSIDFSALSEEARGYLGAAGAQLDTPYERLRRMNQPAIAFYLEHGIDLTHERLEIAVCAQHNNGGLATDAWWETDIGGLFAVGELCGSHGVMRPGGSALNAGQVGAMRAAQRIHMYSLGDGGDFSPDRDDRSIREDAEQFIRTWSDTHGTQEPARLWSEATARMSGCGGMIRDRARMDSALSQARETLTGLTSLVRPLSVTQLPMFYRLRDMLISQLVYLSAMRDHLEHGAASRGSALYTDPDGKLPGELLPELFRCRLDDGAHGGELQEVRLDGDWLCHALWRAVRPIPEMDYFFENQWRLFRERNKTDRF